MIVLGVILILISACLIFISWTFVFGTIWIPISARNAKRLLDLADVKPSDTVYDLGSGDGRIVIEAARRGAIAVGIEIDPVRVLWSRLAIRLAGLAGRVTIRWGNFFYGNLGDATVVTLYLGTSANRRLGPKFERELKAGTRVVSQRFPIEGWVPLETGSDDVYLYVLHDSGRAPASLARSPDEPGPADGSGHGAASERPDGEDLIMRAAA